MAEAIRILLNAAMLFERERFLKSALYSKWQESIVRQMVIGHRCYSFVVQLIPSLSFDSIRRSGMSQTSATKIYIA